MSLFRTATWDNVDIQKLHRTVLLLICCSTRVGYPWPLLAAALRGVGPAARHGRIVELSWLLVHGRAAPRVWAWDREPHYPSLMWWWHERERERDAPPSHPYPWSPAAGWSAGTRGTRVGRLLPLLTGCRLGRAGPTHHLGTRVKLALVVWVPGSWKVMRAEPPLASCSIEKAS